jgi:hypothetical protein
MSYFLKINDVDLSMYVNKLSVGKEHLYKIQGTANGGDRIYYNGCRYVLEVGFVPLDDMAMTKILSVIDNFNVNVSFRDPKTNLMIENILCIIPTNLVEYYTIRADKVSYRAFTVQITQVRGVQDDVIE